MIKLMKMSTEEAIQKLKDTFHIPYTEENLAILREEGGIDVLACAGSGKTTLACSLICKRLLTGEIPDPSKLLVTTYSVAGKEELEERLNVMIKKLGINLGRMKKLEVRTLHSAYYHLLKEIGSLGAINEHRTSMISRAIKESGVKADEDLIQGVDSIMSYQINNMLTDAALAKQYVFNIDIPIEKYTEIAMRYRNMKSQAGVIDFDDMQTRVYALLRTDEKVREMFRSYWNYFIIDEAQDISKIQFEIQKMLITIVENLVFVGDDDQCIVEGSLVDTPSGKVPIEELSVGDKVLSGIGRGKVLGCEIDHIDKRKVKEKIVVIRTASGKELKGTDNHVGFARLVPNENNACIDKDEKMCRLDCFIVGGDNTNEYGIHESELYVSNCDEKCKDILKKYLYSRVSGDRKRGNTYYDFGLSTYDVAYTERVIKDIVEDCENNGIHMDLNRNAKFNDNKYSFTPFGNMIEGMYIPVLVNGEIVEEEVVSVEREEYEGYVYDLSVPDTRNFIVNGAVVHNCIYEWRGADPSIIQNICGYYDIKSLVLSTNFRCGKTIVEHAYKTIRNNSNRTEKKMLPCATKEEGRIIIEPMKNNMYLMSSHIVKEIRYLLDTGLAEEKDIAILCRNNVHGVLIDNMLSQFTLPKVNVEMRFGTNKLVTEVRNAVEISRNTDDPVKATELWKYVQYLSYTNANNIAGVMKDNGCSLKTALKSILYHAFAINKKDDNRMLKSIGTKYRNLEYQLRGEVVDSLSSLYDILSLEDEIQRAKLVIERMLNVTIGFIYNTVDRKRMLYGIADYIIDILEHKGFDAYDEIMKKADKNAHIKADKMKEALSESITISTMHGSKGKQWKYVFLMADDNIALPSFEAIQKMAEDDIPPSEMSNFIEQERRLHYVAMTRAESTLYCYTLNNALSVFMAEALDIIQKYDSKNSHVLDIIKNGGYRGHELDAINQKLLAYRNPRSIVNKETEDNGENRKEA